MTYPTISPELTLDFAKSEQLDPRITFSRSSSATYLGSDGLIKTAPDGVARFEYDSDGKCLGLLIEEARTNLVRASTPTGSGLGNGWSQRANTTITTNAAVAPDGTMTATSVVPDAGSTDRAYTDHTLSSPTTANCVASAFAKPINNFPSTILKSSLATGVLIWNFNFQTGAATVQTDTGDAVGFGSTGFMEPLANGWFRVGFTAPAGLSDLVVNARETWSGPPAADGVSGVLWWGCQVEEGDFQTSFIATAGSTVTRAADIASITGDTSWWNASENTMIFNTISPFTDKAYSLGSVIGTGYTTNSIDYKPLNSKAYANSLRIWNSFRIATWYAGVLQKIALAYDSTAPVYVSGSQFSTQSYEAAYSPIPIQEFNIGQTTLGGVWSGTISRISYYPERVSDESLEALTA